MIRRITFLAITGVLAFALYYASRFWDFRLWERPGLFGWAELPPQGGLVARWLRGSDLAPFELLIWGIGAFLLLTLVQKLFDLLPSDDSGDDHD